MKQYNDMENTESQNAAILRYMQEGHGITPIDALNLCGCFRLSARIHDLRRKGYPVESQTVEMNGKRFSRYSLREE